MDLSEGNNQTKGVSEALIKTAFPTFPRKQFYLEGWRCQSHVKSTTPLNL